MGQILHGSAATTEVVRFTKPDEVLDLVLEPNIWILDRDIFCPTQVWPQDRLVAMSGIAIQYREMLLFEIGDSRLGTHFRHLT